MDFLQNEVLVDHSNYLLSKDVGVELNKFVDFLIISVCTFGVKIRQSVHHNVDNFLLHVIIWGRG